MYYLYFMFTRKLSFTKPMYPEAKALGITEFPYLEYDSNGKITYCESSDGSWCKEEFDSNGKIIYFENGNGLIIRK